MSTIITAKFGSICPNCNTEIIPRTLRSNGELEYQGDRVNWTRGSKATHVDCKHPRTPAARVAPPAPPALAVPMVHLNGTSGQVLREQAADALRAILTAITTVQAMAPHQRDYYLQPDGDDAFRLARNQHMARLTKLSEAHGEIARVLAGIQAQIGGGRSARPAPEPLALTEPAPTAETRQAIPVVTDDSGEYEF